MHGQAARQRWRINIAPNRGAPAATPPDTLDIGDEHHHYRGHQLTVSKMALQRRSALINEHRRVNFTPSPLEGEGWGDPDVSGQTPALPRAREAFQEIRVNSTPRAPPRHLDRELQTQHASKGPSFHASVSALSCSCQPTAKQPSRNMRIDVAIIEVAVATRPP